MVVGSVVGLWLTSVVRAVGHQRPYSRNRRADRLVALSASVPSTYSSQLGDTERCPKPDAVNRHRCRKTVAPLVGAEIEVVGGRCVANRRPPPEAVNETSSRRETWWAAVESHVTLNLIWMV